MSPEPTTAPASPTGPAMFIDRPPVPAGPTIQTGPDIGGVPDMADPDTLRTLADEIAGGLETQAMAADARTGVMGHPFPQHFYGRAAAVIRALAARLPAPTPKEPETPANGGQKPPKK